MANNHGMDFGEAGLRDSLAAAKRHRFPVDRHRARRQAGLRAVPRDRPGPAHRGPRRDAGPRRPPDRELDGRAGQARARVGEGRSAAPPGGQAREKGRRHGRRLPPLGRRARSGARPPTSARSPASSSGRERTSSSAATRTGSSVPGAWGRRSSATGSATSSGTGRASSPRRPGVLLVTATGRRIDGYRWVPARIVDGVPRPLSGTERRSEVEGWRSLRGCTGLKP